MTDHDRLRAAIAAIRRCGVSYGPRETTVRVALQMGVVGEILDAAESTLPPKPPTAWDLTASGRNHAPYESQRVIFEAAEIGGCIAALHGEGFQRVLVTAREVPA